MKERNLIIIKLLVTHVFLILGLVLVALFVKNDNLLLITITQTVLLILFLAGYWEFFSIRFKWIFCAGIETLILFALGIRFHSIAIETPTPFLYGILAFIQLYLCSVLIKIFLVIFNNDKERIEIEFPFKQGKYLITDGGNSQISRIMNYHFHSSVHKKKNTNRSMLYATDIIKLSGGVTRFLPSDNNAYAIFGEKIYSPIDGTIVKVVNNIEDNKPFSGNYPYNTGNTIVIKKDNYYLLLGHMKKGSIIVKEGDAVNGSDYLGEAGNSGMSERPHLHMQLMKSETDDYWKGMGVCLQYEGKNLYKNRLIKK